LSIFQLIFHLRSVAGFLTDNQRLLRNSRFAALCLQGAGVCGEHHGGYVDFHSVRVGNCKGGSPYRMITWILRRRKKYGRN
jgi:hypothetical protein